MKSRQLQRFTQLAIVKELQNLIFGKETKEKIISDNSIGLTIDEKSKVLSSEYPIETLKEILNGK
jgi:hypothetical protein